MNLVEAARKGAEMVDGILKTGDYIVDTGEQTLACAIGAAHIGVTGEYNPDATAYWALSLEMKEDSIADALDYTYAYNDRVATSLEDAIDFIERQYPELAQLAVS